MYLKTVQIKDPNQKGPKTSDMEQPDRVPIVVHRYVGGSRKHLAVSVHGVHQRRRCLLDSLPDRSDPDRSTNLLSRNGFGSVQRKRLRQMLEGSPLLQRSDSVIRFHLFVPISSNKTVTIVICALLNLLIVKLIYLSHSSLVAFS